MRLLLLVLICLFTGYAAPARAERPLTDSSVAQIDACKGRTTRFPEARINSTHTLSRHLDNGDLATEYMKDPGSAGLQGVCRLAHEQAGTQVGRDATKAVVAADILAQTKKLIQSEIDRTKTNLTKQTPCLAQDFCFQQQLQDSNSFVQNHLNTLLGMRSKLALATIDERSISACSTSPNRDARARCYAQSFAKLTLAHPRPFWDRTINAVGLNPSQFNAKLTPLSDTEINRLSNWLADQGKTFGGARFSDLQNTARDQYKSMLIENPMLRYLPGPNATRTDFEEAQQKTLQDLTSARSQINGKTMDQIRPYTQAIETVLENVPDHFRGDYCEIAGQLVRENQNLELNRTVVITGLSLLPVGGGVGVSIRAVSGLSGLATGANFLAGYENYRGKVRECVSASVCSVQELEQASSIAELDLVAVGLTGVSASGAALAKYLARNPSALAKVKARIAVVGKERTEEELKAVAETCLTGNARNGDGNYRYFTLLWFLPLFPQPAFACDMSRLGLAQKEASGQPGPLNELLSKPYTGDSAAKSGADAVRPAAAGAASEKAAHRLSEVLEQADRDHLPPIKDFSQLVSRPRSPRIGDTVRFQVDRAGKPETLSGTLKGVVTDDNGRTWLVIQEEGQAKPTRVDPSMLSRYRDARIQAQVEAASPHERERLTDELLQKPSSLGGAPQSPQQVVDAMAASAVRNPHEGEIAELRNHLKKLKRDGKPLDQEALNVRGRIAELEYPYAPYTSDERALFDSLSMIDPTITEFTPAQKQILQAIKRLRAKNVLSLEDAGRIKTYEDILQLPQKNRKQQMSVLSRELSRAPSSTQMQTTTQNTLAKMNFSNSRTIRTVSEAVSRKPTDLEEDQLRTIKVFINLLDERLRSNPQLAGEIEEINNDPIIQRARKILQYDKLSQTTD